VLPTWSGYHAGKNRPGMTPRSGWRRSRRGTSPASPRIASPAAGEAGSSPGRPAGPGPGGQSLRRRGGRRDPGRLGRRAADRLPVGPARVRGPAGGQRHKIVWGAAWFVDEAYRRKPVGASLVRACKKARAGGGRSPTRPPGQEDRDRPGLRPAGEINYYRLFLDRFMPWNGPLSCWSGR